MVQPTTGRSSDPCSCTNLLAVGNIGRRSSASLRSAEGRGVPKGLSRSIQHNGLGGTTSHAGGQGQCILSRWLLDGDFFKFLAKKPTSRFDPPRLGS
ncbi:UNVERIFIED_CONTAM: hypothetical protein Slati_2633600 [Sesamum latifolium]|uniref:Uncharacterized protein n=1 Tax=Sesamum latifolium TaxID=2727402 RepID=A0AAW2VUZ4_9LAMI